MTKIKLTIGSLEFGGTVHTDLAPETVRSLLAALPIESFLIHAMWSGEMILATDVDLGVSKVENEVSMLVPGDLVYHPRHKEIAIAYGQAQFREPIGPVYVSRVAHLTGDLATLAELGRRVQFEGAKPFTLTHG